MKHILAIVFILVLTVSSAAQEAAKPFDEMTYQELQQVATETLSKQARKSYKKALKKAKYIEKKRRSAEKKRLRAAEKARAKREKAIRKRLKKVNKYYDNTTIAADEFSVITRVRAPVLSPIADWNSLFFGAKNQPQYSLVANINPDGNKSIVLRLAVNSHIQGLSIHSLELLDILPEEYATLKHLWPNHHTALVTGGARRTVKTVEQRENGCTVEDCYFLERSAVYLKLSDIADAVIRRDPLAVKVLADNEQATIVRLPFAYLLGFIERLSEADSQFSNLKQMAKAGRTYLIQTAS